MDLVSPFIWGPLVSGLMALLVIIVLTPFSERLRLMDLPDERKRHGEPVPMIGGIAIFMALLGVAQVYPMDALWNWLLAGASLLVLVGFLDDVFDLGVRARLFAQIFACGLMIWGAQLSVTDLGTIGGIEFELGLFGLVVTFVATVGLINAFNMVDGIDGLAGGHALIALVSMMVGQWLSGGIAHQFGIAILASSIFAFWLVNMSLTPLRKVFLGDAGSLILGFLIGWLLVALSQGERASLNPVMTIWCVTLPVFDTIAVVARRLGNGRSPFSADRRHLHHLLIDMGMTKRGTLIILLCLGCGLNAIGLFVTASLGALMGLGFWWVCFAIFALFTFHPKVGAFLRKDLSGTSY